MNLSTNIFHRLWSHIPEHVFFRTTLTGCSGLLIYALFTNQLWLYDVSITIHIRRSHQKKSTLNQHRFQILNQSKEAGRQLGGENVYEEQSQSISPTFDFIKCDAHTECYKKFTVGSNIAKRKSEGKGTSTPNNTKKLRRSGEGAKQLSPKQCMICKYRGAIKISFGVCWPCKHQLML